VEALMDDRPRYMISVAAEFVGMHPHTLRIYEKAERGNPRERLFS
jgi:DNA-binding transcriptional MerR regulator